MSRTLPIELVKGNHLTKAEKERRLKQEQQLNSKLKRDKLQPPEWLGKEAIKMFEFIVDQYNDADLLTNLDINALATYCDLHERRLELLEDVRVNGPTLKNRNSKGYTTYVTNPALTALNTTIKLLQTYESRFGFTVFDRTKLAIKDEDPKPVNKFNKFKNN